MKSINSNFVNYQLNIKNIQKKDLDKNVKEETKKEEPVKSQSHNVPNAKPVTAKASDVIASYGRAVIGGKDRDDYNTLVQQWNRAVASGKDKESVRETLTNLIDRIIENAPEEEQLGWRIVKLKHVHHRQVYTLQQTYNSLEDGQAEFDSVVLEPWNNVINRLLDPNTNINAGGFVTDDVAEDWNEVGPVYETLPLNQKRDALVANIDSWKALKLAIQIKQHDPNCTSSQQQQLSYRLSHIQNQINTFTSMLESLNS